MTHLSQVAIQFNACRCLRRALDYPSDVQVPPRLRWRPGKNNLTAFNHIESIREVRHVVDVGFGNEHGTTKRANIGETFDNRGNNNRGEPFCWLIKQQQLW